jgi:sugar diacid utilization regulator
VPLVAGDELLGLLVAEQSTALDLARGVASQAAVGIKKVQLIERLTEENAIRDFFAELARGAVSAEFGRRAAGVGVDLDHEHVVVAAESTGEALGRALTGLAPGALWDRREKSLVALLPVPPGGVDRLVASIRHLQQRRSARARIGVSSASTGPQGLAAAFAQAKQALLGTVVLRGEPTVVAYEQLGAYKYLLRLASEGTPRDATVEAVARIAGYDRDRGAQLLATLEEFLGRHGSVSATSEALYVHPNTLRQRLRRIAEISGLDLAEDDWLMVEIAVKLVRLESVLGATSPADRESGRRILDRDNP